MMANFDHGLTYTHTHIHTHVKLINLIIYFSAILKLIRTKKESFQLSFKRSRGG